MKKSEQHNNIAIVFAVIILFLMRISIKFEGRILPPGFRTDKMRNRIMQKISKNNAPEFIFF